MDGLPRCFRESGSAGWAQLKASQREVADLISEQEAVRLKMEEVDRQQAELNSLQESLQKERAENDRQLQVRPQICPSVMS